jgi:hypothetical protein
MYSRRHQVKVVDLAAFIFATGNQP